MQQFLRVKLRSKLGANAAAVFPLSFTPKLSLLKSYYAVKNEIFLRVISLDSEFGMKTRGFQEVYVNEVVSKASMLS